MLGFRHETHHGHEINDKTLYWFIDKSVRPPHNGEKRKVLYSVKAGSPPSSSRTGLATFFLPWRSEDSLNCQTFFKVQETPQRVGACHNDIDDIQGFVQYWRCESKHGKRQSENHSHGAFIPSCKPKCGIDTVPVFGVRPHTKAQKSRCQKARWAIISCRRLCKRLDDETGWD